MPELVRKLDTLSFALLPDLIVLDRHKPPYGEGELVRYIRSHERMDSIALIVYTTIIQESKKNTMLHDGVDCAMTKGNTTQEIADHVAIFCQVIANKKSYARDRRKA